MDWNSIAEEVRRDAEVARRYATFMGISAGRLGRLSGLHDATCAKFLNGHRMMSDAAAQCQEAIAAELLRRTAEK